MTIKWALVKTSPFQGLSEEETHDILSRMLCVHYDPGERLELGREPGGWWVVEKGLMKVYSIAPDGSALTYAILGAGDSFGETTILTGHWVRATVEALEPTEVRYLSADQFETLLREHPDFALALLRNLAERIRQSEERVFHISRLKLGQRVAHALLGLAQTIGEQTDAGLEIHLTHQEIADYVGASREAVSRTLGRWARKGWIATNRKSVIIKDLRPFQIAVGQTHTAA
ncbi:MAG: Crp/Fnr family transcriptional regulator [Fimbriimonadales bacterium]|nr:MAG: Crp/Fnr family transcriptional regulator [Fimbriimonadales bacterium]